MQQKIQEYFNNACLSLRKEFSDQRLLGVFAIGRINYNLMEKPEDLSVMAVYLPTLDDLCTTTSIRKYAKMVDNIRVEIRDIRYGYECARAETPLFIEMMITDLYWVNPRYQYHYDNIRERAEDIFKINKRSRLQLAYGYGVSQIDAFEKDNDSAHLQEAIRVQIVMDGQIRGQEVSKCIKIEDEFQLNYLRQVREHPETIDIKGLRDSYARTKMKVDLEYNKVDTEVFEMFKYNLKKVMILSMKKISDVDVFFNSLTSAEKGAFCNLIPLRDKKNNIVVILSEFTQKFHVSYPVVRSLLNKLEKSELAAITNRGTKGTVVQILHQGLIEKVEDYYDNLTL